MADPSGLAPERMTVLVPHERTGVVTVLAGDHPGGTGVVAPAGPGPQAFRVDLDAGHDLGVHYHRVDQFQVVVAGGGRVGRHPVRRGDLHYADAFTPYGPLVAGPDGLAYLTLRPVGDHGARWMPAARQDLAVDRAVDGRQDHRNLVITGGDGVDHPDGLQVRRLRLADGETIGSAATSGAVRFTVVIHGVVSVDDCHAAEGSVLMGAPVTGYDLRALGVAEVVEVDLPALAHPGASRALQIARRSGLGRPGVRSVE